MHLEEEDVQAERPDAEPEAEPEDADLDDDTKHRGVAIVACDQSAITGESLAVDKFMVGTLDPFRGFSSNFLGRCSLLHRMILSTFPIKIHIHNLSCRLVVNGVKHTLLSRLPPGHHLSVVPPVSSKARKIKVTSKRL